MINTKTDGMKMAERMVSDLFFMTTGMPIPLGIGNLNCYCLNSTNKVSSGINCRVGSLAGLSHASPY